MVVITLRKSDFQMPGWVKVLCLKRAFDRAMGGILSKPLVAVDEKLERIARRSKILSQTLGLTPSKPQGFIDEVLENKKLIARDSGTLRELRSHFNLGVVNYQELIEFGKVYGFGFRLQQPETDANEHSHDAKPSRDELKSCTGTAAGNDYVQPQEEPPLKCGTNTRSDCIAWCAYMAQEYKDQATTRNALAELIKAESDRRKYLMQGGNKFSIHMIVSAIPKGTTGTLQDNRNGGKKASVT